MARPLPARSDLVAYKEGVAGHDGTLSDSSGELFIKPCTQAEISFYESATAAHPEFAEYMPTFLGVLTLDPDQSKTIEEQGAILIAEAEAMVKKHGHNNKKIVTTQAVVLENAAYGFQKPNILDIKLGVRLFADSAREEKKIRFSKITEETTHKDLGFRIAGMRVWQGPNAQGDDINEDGYKVYDRSYGMSSMKSENIEEAFKNFISVESAGMDKDLSRLIAEAFLVDIQRIQEALEGDESRMYSASLLFVFEGDGEALRTAMEEASCRPITNDTAPEAYEEDEDEDEDDYTEPKVYSVKMIDFAHARWVPGEGPDENSLVGVRSLARILGNLARS